MPSNSSAAKLEVSANLFAALGDETRLRLVTRLCQSGPLSISELSSGFKVTRQAVTKHLYLMEEAGLVSSTRQGRNQIWEIEQKRIEVASAFLDLISRRWDSALERLKKHVEAD